MKIKWEPVIQWGVLIGSFALAIYGSCVAGYKLAYADMRGKFDMERLVLRDEIKAKEAEIERMRKAASWNWIDKWTGENPELADQPVVGTVGCPNHDHQGKPCTGKTYILDVEPSAPSCWRMFCEKCGVMFLHNMWLKEKK